MSWTIARVSGCAVIAVLMCAVSAASASAQDAGMIKIVRGTAHVEREGKKTPAVVGMKVREADVVSTGADGTMGITFGDSSLLSIGPNSSMSIDRYAFDTTTHQGALETSLKAGTLAAVSGKIAKQSPNSMKVRTPTAVLGVRGTEFVVRTGETMMRQEPGR